MKSKNILWKHRRNVHKIDLDGNPIVVKRRNRKLDKKRVKPKVAPICHLCGKSFTWTSGLTKHLKYFHEKQFDKRCHVCGMGVYASQRLNMHLLSKHPDDPVSKKMVEEGAKLWRCTVVGCRVVYWKQSGLEGHMKKVHGGNGEDANKPLFSCSFCGKTFWRWHRLNCHETRHKLGNERPFSCDLCGAKLKMADSVTKHKRKFHPSDGKLAATN